MPPPSRFVKPATRSIVVALAMGVLLLLSLAAAWAYSLGRHQSSEIDFLHHTLGRATLQLPDGSGWQTDDSALIPSIFADGRVIDERSRSPRRLLVGEISLDQPRVPAQVLDLTLSSITAEFLRAPGRRAIASQLTHIRTQTMVGLCLSAMISVQGDDGGAQPLRVTLAILTPDGKRYWAVFIAHPMDPRDADLRTATQRINDDRNLAYTIAASIQPEPPATPPGQHDNAA